jgi:hypothetical protein
MLIIRTQSIILSHVTSSNLRGTSDSGVYSTEMSALPPAGTVPAPGETVNGPIGNRPCVCTSLDKRRHCCKRPLNRRQIYSIDNETTQSA